MATHTDIPYRQPPDPLFSYNIHHPPGSESYESIICFVHGGAWRSEDKAQHQPLANALATASGLPVLLPNYRLSPAVKHPTHTEDTLAFLEFVLEKYQCKNIYLLGHSCSAHMLSSIVLDAPGLSPTPALLSAIKCVVFTEGIFDIDLLLRSFPKYLDWFIADAFRPSPLPSPPSPTSSSSSQPQYPDVNAYKPRADTKHIHWLLLHSNTDTLIDEVQSQTMFDYLVGLGHFEAVERDFKTLVQEHDEVLASPEYVKLVVSAISTTRARV